MVALSLVSLDREATQPTGYTPRDVSRLLDLPESEVRSYLEETRLPHTGEADTPRLTFSELALLRAAKSLRQRRIAPRRIRTALRGITQRLAGASSIGGLCIVAEGRQIVVREGARTWNAESGQILLDFEEEPVAGNVTPFVPRKAEEETSGARRWFEEGCALEASAPREAMEAYRRTLELDDGHVDAHLNLGRLLHEGGEVDAAEQHYRRALEKSPRDATAAFNLGVALEDLGRRHEAIEAYERAIAIDPRSPDACFNAARLHEELGQRSAALRHLKQYRDLTQNGNA